MINAAISKLDRYGHIICAEPFSKTLYVVSNKVSSVLLESEADSNAASDEFGLLLIYVLGQESRRGSIRDSCEEVPDVLPNGLTTPIRISHSPSQERGHILNHQSPLIDIIATIGEHLSKEVDDWV